MHKSDIMGTVEKWVARCRRLIHKQTGEGVWYMSIRYKIDVMDALKSKGYSTYRLRKDKIFGEKTMQDFRTGKCNKNYRRNPETLGLIFPENIQQEQYYRIYQ